ncbi:MAG: hypothetical protein KDA32_00920 [Phycisphaerales bacterium]|nr:hypothetical protein [Phycisphaerales bacterium]
MRSGLIVVGICLAVSIVAGVVLAGRYRGELVQVEDVVTGLIYFLEKNEGRFPQSQEEFEASPFVETGPQGVRILSPEQTKYRKPTHGDKGLWIPSLEPFKINWGAQLDGLTVDEFGNARDTKGDKVRLVRWPSSEPSAKEFTILLLRVAAENRPKAAKEASPP